MARGKRAAKMLTLEEKLEQALVPVEEQPYSIPGNWCWTTLKNIVEIIMGQSPAGTATTDDDSYIPLIGGAADMGGLYPKVARYTKVPTKLSCNDDIILCIRATLGHPIFSDGKYCLGRGVAAIRPYQGKREFYRYFFLNFEQYLYDNATGTTFAQVNGAILQDMPVPFPPLAEQQRIVERIESLFAKLDEAKEKAQAVVDGFELHKSAILHKAFTGELTSGSDSNRVEHILQEVNSIREAMIASKAIQRPKVKELLPEEKSSSFPVSWRQVKLGEIAFVTKLAGFEYTKYFHLEDAGDIPVIRAQNVRKGYLDIRNLLYIDKETSELLPRSALDKKCILITFIGAGIGDVCVFDEAQRFHLAPNVAKAEPYCGGSDSLINIRYILHYLMSHYGQDEIFKNMKATAQPSLSMETIRDIIIPVPDISEQNDIVQILDSLIEKEQQAKEAAESVLDQIDTMKKAILARAFRGELGTNDPAEESAVELLKTVL